MLNKKNCYEVEVKPTSAMRNASHTTFDYDRNKGDYFDCEDGKVYVLANTLTEVEELIGAAAIISCRKVGVGYAQEFQRPSTVAVASARA